MTMTFPSSPSLNDTYTADGRTWFWNGYAWKAAGYTSGVVSSTSPITYDSSTKVLGLDRMAEDSANDARYIQLDGSTDLLTVGDLSATSGTIGAFTATTVDTGDVDAATGTIAAFSATTVVTGDVSATTGQIGSLATTLSSPVFAGQSLENFYISATGFAGYTFDAVTNGAIQYLANNSTANGTLNIRATSTQTLNAFMSVGQVITITLIVPNGTTAYYPTAYQIDGSAVTPKWSGGTAPSGGNASATDFYTLSIFKTGVSTYSVFASQTKNS